MKKILVLVVVVFITAVSLYAQSEDKNIPRTLNYTGNLFDYAGQPINKAVDLNIKFYNSKTSDSVLWSEDQKNVQVEYGYFSVNLGTETPLYLDFSKPLWVELKLGDSIYPRVIYTSNPYTFQCVNSYESRLKYSKYKQDSTITSKKIEPKEQISNKYGWFDPRPSEPPTVKDYSELKKLVEYPEEAIKGRIEGKVIVAVYIDTAGKPMKTRILDTENPILNKAAIDAVMQYNGYTAATEDGVPFNCWLQVPIEFKLPTPEKIKK